MQHVCMGRCLISSNGCTMASLSAARAQTQCKGMLAVVCSGCCAARHTSGHRLEACLIRHVCSRSVRLGVRAIIRPTSVYHTMLETFQPVTGHLTHMRGWMVACCCVSTQAMPRRAYAQAGTWCVAGARTGWSVASDWFASAPHQRMVAHCMYCMLHCMYRMPVSVGCGHGSFCWPIFGGITRPAPD
jgi:hypothetical protein